jgi:acyl-CoA reductase-like NAD-dependent aldehyde dehydrogenase
VGPLIDEAALARVAEFVAIGRSEGRLACGGEPATDGDLGRGLYFQPTMFSDVMPMARIAQEEIFGPVHSVIPVDGYDEVVQAVNGARQRHIAGIYTGDAVIIERAVRDFDVREVHFNPSGRESAGALAGAAAVDTFTRQKSVVERRPG